MSFKETLVEAGFSEDEAERLVNNHRFAQQNSNKSAEEIKKKIETIANIYLTTETAICKSAFSFPPFAGYDHHRVLQGIKDTYNCTAEQASKAVLSHPSFAGYDHHRALQGIKDTYNCTAEQASKAVFSFPPFAGLDHHRVLQGIKDTYNCTAEQASKAVLSFPSFAGLDHHRVLRQLSRTGRIAGLNENEVIERILKNPVFAGYSAKRYLAAIDIGRELRKEGIPDVSITRTWFSYLSKSPYVPDTKRLRIAQAAKQDIHGEPPLMTVMRKRLRAAN